MKEGRNHGPGKTAERVEENDNKIKEIQENYVEGRTWAYITDTAGKDLWKRQQ